MAEQTSPRPDVTKTDLSDHSDLSLDVTKADPPKHATPAALSPDQIEAEIALTRAHLASTINELTIRTQPREIVRRQKESAKARFVVATHTPEGDLRVERIGALAAAGAALVVVLALLRRRHHRG